ncbi:hypothetical protein [Candidatus Kuenenia stuttgartiensis]|uniref:hypothetical protein n=1 Tax=Kuenenia stuttgartiensis TaxID=174633 RepID=UPI001469CF2B|nr:hypothetical protein [Candidatus Kuenenia stuttgartiensis]
MRTMIYSKAAQKRGKNLCTVEEVLRKFDDICSMEVTNQRQKASCQRSPRPRSTITIIIRGITEKLPDVLPSRNIR